MRTGGRWLAVARVSGRHEVDARWWTEHPIARTYVDLLLEDERVLTVFHDRIANTWYEQRYG